ncbi:hypothetical protein GE061_019393 [Apolygus lucorum]|uniref:Uncharacterized protein n=1 Tax=Apolygus lucorum TaxID=248454 RepID=A0A6A4JR09_APOLU|nr:hypothetical protein GE061_019393 [Apolygus lucorum]
MFARLLFICTIALFLVICGVELSPVHREKRFIYYYPPGSNTSLNQNYTLSFVPLGTLLFGGGTFRLG